MALYAKSTRHEHECCHCKERWTCYVRHPFKFMSPMKDECGYCSERRFMEAR